MVNDDMALSRGSIEEIAGSLQQLVMAAPDSRQRRQLADCAARLQAVARTIYPQSIAPVGRTQAVLDAARMAGDRMGQIQRSSVLLLGLLLARPGMTRPSRDLATMIGISPQSVRVFAFHLRKWLVENGYPDALRSQWGTGYMLTPRAAQALLRAEPLFAALVREIEAVDPADHREAA
jgi:hypothetical protein